MEDFALIPAYNKPEAWSQAAWDHWLMLMRTVDAVKIKDQRRRDAAYNKKIKRLKKQSKRAK